ncbi:hypothetical protein [Streptomyces smyrnaeus]|uniref:hypothetical protein n=1 Tax=Streptomyces smyrnaeus TaxID=1387713 RepID=UPI000C180014
MTHHTQQLIDLCARAHALTDRAQLRKVLVEADGWYQGVLAAHESTRYEQLSVLDDQQLAKACEAASLPCGPGLERRRTLLSLLALEWSETPAALAYESITEHAARQGVCLVDEETA